MNKVVLSVVAALAVSAVPAFAADMPVKASKVAVAAPVNPWDVAFGAAVMNDYIFRGVTQSAHKASGAVYIEPRYNVSPNLQLYVGTSVETIKFPNDAKAEWDLYGGVRPTFGALALDFGFWYYGYPGGNCYNIALQGCSRNATLPNGNVIKGKLSFWEVYAKATYTAGDWAFGPTFYYTPSFLNSGAPGEYLSGIVKYTAPATMAINKDIGWYVSGEFGRQWLGTSDSFYSIANTPTSAGIKYADYNTWNIGLGFTWKTLTLDLRYSDTDLSKGNCNAFTSDPGASGTTNITANNPGGLGSNWCGARFVAKLSVDFTMANFR